MIKIPLPKPTDVPGMTTHAEDHEFVIRDGQLFLVMRWTTVYGNCGVSTTTCEYKITVDGNILTLDDTVKRECGVPGATISADSLRKKGFGDD